ncbi:Gfo/Idh/MocA family oxidoreductase [Actinoplanes sp. NBRC 101535]|uniref:Gfo/Idh/MocA family protein n=1 Tax=Actinoplanes sp. NBRC 101535 TaxID=3032196 RepID=UPI0024A2BFE0|nr:Gfo/Idh/MocA family oxidoreductase [Actinoplanes sp. NBRC 101535]GLY02762.1 hypothetical protein Acsp01_31410 [Actinoplanes sp. NBRC 101535]
MSARPLGVGFLGAGAVVQTIHLPTLARLRDRLETRVVMDVNPQTAAAVAARAGARATTSESDLLADTSVDIVAICSPPEFHAAQVVAAIRAGKRTILCEKPLASSPEGIAAIREAANAGVRLAVGAMHVHDPAWTAVKPHLFAAHTVRSSIVLPFNDRFEDAATQLLPRPAFAMGELDDAARRAMLEAAVLGLAIHDLPLVRAFLPRRPSLFSARFLEPFGYAINLSTPDTVVELHGLMQPHWQPRWTFEAVSADASLHVDFTPSFVHAGSAVATLADKSGVRVFGPYPMNGYEAEWRALATGAPLPPLDEVLDDISFAVDIAVGATA